MNGKTIRAVIGPLISIVLIGFAVWALGHELKGLKYQEIVAHIKSLSHVRLLLAFGFTVGAYWVLTGYDTLALRFIRFPMTYSRIAFTSFVSYVFSNNIGMAVIGVSAARYRLYSAWGMSVIDIAKLIAFCSLTFWLGLFGTAGVVFMIHPVSLPETYHLPFALTRALGAVFLAGVLAYLLATGLRKRPLKIGKWLISTPSVWFSLSQLSVASMDWIMTGAILYVLIPPELNMSFSSFLGIYLLAVSAGLVSHVPGGLGVFEFAFLFLIPISDASVKEKVVGALLVYRALYYLLPLCLAAVLLGAHEVILKKKTIRWLSRAFGQWVPDLAPHVLGLTVFLGGVALLFSSATPAKVSHLLALEDAIPRPLLEGSHLLASAAGAWLLLLSRGLMKRLRPAYYWTLITLGLGVVFSLMSGLDYEVAGLLIVILGALAPCVGQFYEKRSPLKQALNTGWAAAVTVVLVCTVWLTLFSYRQFNYPQDLLTEFSATGQQGEAARALRACIGAFAVAFAFATVRLVRTLTAKPAPATPSDLQTAQAIVSRSRKTYAGLALLGDKRFLFSHERTAFIMYGIHDRSWISLGDPVGPDEERTELATRFREMVGLRGWAAFYDLQEASLPSYADLNLSVLTLGDEARVRLDSFSLQDSGRTHLQAVREKLTAEGYSFSVTPISEIPWILQDMRRVSDEWLAAHKAHERGFSLGFFNETYLRQFPAGVVRKEGKIVAYTNLLTGAEHEEAAPETVRYVTDAPEETITFLFTEAALWAQQESYRWLSLGMSPVAEPARREHDFLRVGLEPAIFRHGEHFGDFRALRNFKMDFRPIFEPRYLACPSSVPLPQLLRDLSALVSHHQSDNA